MKLRKILDIILLRNYDDNLQYIGFPENKLKEVLE